MDITCISDLHGHYPELEGGDLLIVAGDLTARDTEEEYWAFNKWLNEQYYLKIVVIAGNHDNGLVETKDKMMAHAYCHPYEYLCDSGTEYEWCETHITKWGTRPVQGGRQLKVKIWGSPWTKTFPGINPNCKAFTVDTEEELAEKWAMIPEQTDILITHSPAYGFGDEVTRIKDYRIHEEHAGSTSLLKWISNHSKSLKLNVCGHIHGGYRVGDVRAAKKMCNDPMPSPILVNASHVNERYEPVNKPIRIIL